MANIRWLPLESNPEVMNRFLESLGVPSKWGISDVISLDDELLTMVPAPSLAFLLLFPISDAHEDYSKQKVEETEKSGSPPSKLYFMKQTIRNACGTVALIHALSNNVDCLDLEEKSPLAEFIETTKSLSPEEKGRKLECDESIGVAHENTALQGQTETPNIDAEVNLHFVAFVNVDGALYELDGRRGVPVSHGSTSADTFITDAARVCREFIKRDPENVNFTALSLGPMLQ